MKRTYQPSRTKRTNKHGFRARMATKNGRLVLKRRRAKGRKKLTVSDEQIVLIDQSLPKKTMLQRNQDFGIVFLQGQHIHNEYFSIYFVKEEELCVGFTTKKDYKSKPTRNRMKRILRELWRKNFRKYLLPAHIVIVARMNILKEKHEHLDNLMNAALTEMEKKLNAMRLEQEK